MSKKKIQSMRNVACFLVCMMGVFFSCSRKSAEKDSLSASPKLISTPSAYGSGTKYQQNIYADTLMKLRPADIGSSGKTSYMKTPIGYDGPR